MGHTLYKGRFSVAATDSVFHIGKANQGRLELLKTRGSSGASGSRKTSRGQRAGPRDGVRGNSRGWELHPEEAGDPTHSGFWQVEKI